MAFAAPGAGLVFAPENPILDAFSGNETITVVVDLSPEAKQTLSGNGTIAVDLRADDRLELVGGARGWISHVGSVTQPASFRLRKTPGAPRPDNEFAAYFLEGLSTGEETLRGAANVLVRGPYFRTVDRYLAANSRSAAWDRAGISDVGALVQYRVPESAFLRWIPWLNRPADIALAYQLGLGEAEVKNWDASEVVGVYGSFELRLRGWKSSADYWDLSSAYGREVAAWNENYSFAHAAAVPVAFFLEQLAKLPAEWDSGIKDYEITARFHRDRGSAALSDLGLDAAAVMASLESAYLLADYNPVAPEVLAVAGRTWVDPEWRKQAPLALCVMSAEVSEGTFSESRLLPALAKEHRLVLGQASGADDFRLIASRALERHGRVDLLLLSGHGSPFGGPVFAIDEQVFARLREVLNPDATVVVAACATAGWTTEGKSFARALREALPGRRIIAAPDNTNAIYLAADPDAKTPADRYRVYMSGTALMEDVPALAPWPRANARVGKPFRMKIRASNSPSLFSAAGLPPGLSVDVLRGEIKGVPRRAGRFRVQVAAENSGGRDEAFRLIRVLGPR